MILGESKKKENSTSSIFSLSYLKAGSSTRPGDQGLLPSIAVLCRYIGFDGNGNGDGNGSPGVDSASWERRRPGLF